MSKFEGMSLLRKDEGPTEEEKARAAALQAYLVSARWARDARGAGWSPNVSC